MVDRISVWMTRGVKDDATERGGERWRCGLCMSLSSMFECGR